MIKAERLRRLFIIATAVALTAVTGGSKPPVGAILSVSIPALHIAAGERVVGFDFQVESGRIVQVPDMPIGWNISVDNDPSWNTKINAAIIVAAAAVDALFFKHFLVIEKEAAPNSPFDMKGEVIVSKDFSATRRISVGMSDLTLAPLAQH
jgi:hypothetical protein